MNEKIDPLSEIERQFTRQGDAYTRLAYVKDDAGLQKIVALSEARATDAVLDVACGPGFLTLAFAQACERVVGVDTTEAFLVSAREEATKRELDNVEFVHGNVEKLDFEDDLFDVVICRAAFHHFPEPRKVLEEMKRVTKVGGKILVLDMIASEDSEKAAYHNLMERLCDPTHARALSESEFSGGGDGLSAEEEARL